MGHTVLIMTTTERGRLAREVRAELARRGMSRAQLADQAGINRHTIQRRLSAQHPFTYEELANVARALGLPLSELIERAESSVEVSG